jgi:hypothetical protein
MGDTNVNVHVYFVHCSKLKDRDTVLLKFQNLMNSMTKNHRHIRFSFNKVTKHEPHEMLAIGHRIFTKEDLEPSENQFYNSFKMPSCSIEMLSNAMKHQEALKLISMTIEMPNTHHIYMVLEDDIAFDNDIQDALYRLFEHATFPAFDFVFLGLPGDPMDATSDESKLHLVPMNDDLSSKISPVCDAYIVTKNMASKMLQSLNPIRYPFNIQLSFVLDKLKANVGRVYPNLTLDGSKFGNFPSSIVPNNILLFNNVYKLIYKMLEMPSMTQVDVDKINDLFENHGNRDSPDFLFLEGLFFLRIREFEKSKSLFDRAIDLYQSSNSPLNRTSLIVLNYIELSKQMHSASLSINTN